MTNPQSQTLIPSTADNSVPVWTPDIENVLDHIRLNAYHYSEKHRKRFLNLKNTANYFDIPVIIISAANTIISVGVQAYLNQQTISITNCVLSAVCGIIVSIKLYLAIQAQMEVEIATSKDFYSLSVEIYKTISLCVPNRGVDGITFLNECFQKYNDLVQKSNILNKNIKDKMVPDKIPSLPLLQANYVLPPNLALTLPSLTDSMIQNQIPSLPPSSNPVTDLESGINTDESNHSIHDLSNNSV